MIVLFTEHKEARFRELQRTNADVGEREVVVPGPLESLQAKGGEAIPAQAVLPRGAEEPLEEGEAKRGRAPCEQRLHLQSNHYISQNPFASIC